VKSLIGFISCGYGLVIHLVLLLGGYWWCGGCLNVVVCVEFLTTTLGFGNVFIFGFVYLFCRMMRRH
jgi:hypothetical protein